MHRKGSNPAAPGKGAITFFPHVGRPGRAVPERWRWAVYCWRVRAGHMRKAVLGRAACFSTRGPRDAVLTYPSAGRTGKPL
jgi:hypothetical protein